VFEHLFGRRLMRTCMIIINSHSLADTVAPRPSLHLSYKLS